MTQSMQRVRTGFISRMNPPTGPGSLIAANDELLEDRIEGLRFAVTVSVALVALVVPFDMSIVLSAALHFNPSLP